MDSGSRSSQKRPPWPLSCLRFLPVQQQQQVQTGQSMLRHGCTTKRPQPHQPMAASATGQARRAPSLAARAHRVSKPMVPAQPLQPLNTRAVTHWRREGTAPLRVAPGKQPLTAALAVV